MKLTQQLEAVLFVAEGPLNLEQLADVIETDTKAIKAALDELKTNLAERGIRLSYHHNGYRLVSAPEAAEAVRRLLEDQAKAELSKPALETLSIIAYRGPISRAGIETIRGVGSEVTIRGLLSRELITISGKAKEPGRPPLYSVSPQFLDLFGLGQLDQLPPLEEVADAA
jgi:segregation and condensation protein B